MTRFWHQMETAKKSEPQMGLEPTTLRDLVDALTAKLLETWWRAKESDFFRVSI